MVDGRGDSPDPVTRLRRGAAARLLAATLAGVADALDDRVHEREPEVEDRPDPADDRWLVLLDREDPSRSLIIVPHSVVVACRARDAAAARARARAADGAGAAHNSVGAGTRHDGLRLRWAAWRATVRRRWTTSTPIS